MNVRVRVGTEAPICLYICRSATVTVRFLSHAVWVYTSDACYTAEQSRSSESPHN